MNIQDIFFTGICIGLEALNVMLLFSEIFEFKFLKGVSDLFISIDAAEKCIDSRRSQSLVFSKMKNFVQLTREACAILPTNILNRGLSYSPNIFQDFWSSKSKSYSNLDISDCGYRKISNKNNVHLITFFCDRRELKY